MTVSGLKRFNKNAQRREYYQKKAFIALGRDKTQWSLCDESANVFSPAQGYLAKLAHEAKEFLILSNLINPFLAADDPCTRPCYEPMVAVFNRSHRFLIFYTGTTPLHSDDLLRMTFNIYDATLERQPDKVRIFLENVLDDANGNTTPEWVKDIARDVLTKFKSHEEQYKTYKENQKEKRQQEKMAPNLF